MAGGLGFSIRGRWTHIGVGYRLRKVAFRNYREDPAILRPNDSVAAVILGRSLFLKHGRSSVIWIRLSKVFQGHRDCESGLRSHLQVGRASGRSGPLGTSGTLVVGDPWVPMSHTRSRTGTLFDVASRSSCSSLSLFKLPVRSDFFPCILHGEDPLLRPSSTINCRVSPFGRVFSLSALAGEAYYHSGLDSDLGQVQIA
jgi:hypothetical protein